MIEILNIEEETQFVDLSVGEVPPRDFAATEDLISSFAGLLRQYGRYLDEQNDPSIEQESKFTAEVESLENTLSDASYNIRSLLNK